MDYKKKQFEALIEKYGLSYIQKELSKYLTKNRIEKIDQVLKKRITSLEVAFESPVDIHNAIASFRTMEALGVTDAHIIDAKFKKSKGKKTTQGAHQWVNVNYHDTLDSFLGLNQTFLVGASVDGTKDIKDLPLDKNICIIFGNEKSGLSNKALEKADLLYKIPVYGMSQSYNLSVSCAISLYEYLRVKRDHIKSDGDINQVELEEQRTWYYFLSLGSDLSEKIINRKV